MPETQYTFTIKASLNEAKTENGIYTPIIENGKKLEEIHTYTFITNKGLKTIPSQLLVNSYPLHSHSSFIDNNSNSSFFFEFNKVLNSSYFDVPNNSNAKIYAVLMKGDEAIDNKLIRFKNTKWEFDKFNLALNSEYRIEFIIKSAQNSGSGKSTTQVVNNQFGGIYKMQKGMLSGISRAVQGLTVSYIHFTTSAYKTLEEKIANLTLNEIKVGSGGNLILLSRANSKETNARFINSLPLKCPINSINFYGEKFISPDYEEYTSSSIFKNNVRTIIPPLFDNLNTFDYERTKTFLSEISGISDVKIDFKGYVICRGANANNAYIVNCPSKNSYGEEIKIPYTPPLFNFGINKSLGGFFNRSGEFVIPITFQINNIMYECPINVRPAIENPVQVIIDARVNPAGYKGANNAQNWNSFNAGIASFGRGVNKNLVKGVAGKSFR